MTLRGVMSLALAAFGTTGSALYVAAVAPGTWSERAPLPTARSEVAVAEAGGILYVIGGYANGRVDQPLVEAYDAGANQWSTRAPLPQGLNHVGAVALGGKVYAIGGFVRQNRDAVDSAFVYDPRQDAWRRIARLPSKRGSVSLAVLDGKIHAVGGRDVTSVTTHDVYDPATDRWSSAAPLPLGEGRDHMGLLAYDGHLYAIAGRVNDFRHNTNLLEAYDPRDDRWTQLARMPTARSGGAAVVYHDLLLYIGGEREGGTFTENEAYEPRTGRWYELTPLPEGRHGTGAAVVRDAVLLPAGAPTYGGSRQSTTLYAFTQS